MTAETTHETWTLNPGRAWPFRWSITDETGREVVSGGMSHYSTEDRTIFDVIARDPEANGRIMRDLRRIAEVPAMLRALEAIARLTPHDDVTEAINLARATVRNL